MERKIRTGDVLTPDVRRQAEDPGMRGKGRKCGLEREMEVTEREEVSIILLREYRLTGIFPWEQTVSS